MALRTQGPVVTAMGLLGAAGLLGGAFWFGHALSQDDGSPDVGLWADDQGDRLQVVLGDPQADWGDLEIEADAPIQFQADGRTGSGGPGAPAPLGGADDPVYGGQRVELCAVGAPRVVQVTVRSDDGHVVFQQSMALARCPAT